MIKRNNNSGIDIYRERDVYDMYMYTYTMVINDGYQAIIMPVSPGASPPRVPSTDAYYCYCY